MNNSNNTTNNADTFNFDVDTLMSIINASRANAVQESSLSRRPRQLPMPTLPIPLPNYRSRYQSNETATTNSNANNPGFLPVSVPNINANIPGVLSIGQLQSVHQTRSNKRGIQSIGIRRGSGGTARKKRKVHIKAIRKTKPALLLSITQVHLPSQNCSSISQKGLDKLIMVGLGTRYSTEADAPLFETVIQRGQTWLNGVTPSGVPAQSFKHLYGFGSVGSGNMNIKSLTFNMGLNRGENDLESRFTFKNGTSFLNKNQTKGEVQIVMMPTHSSFYLCTRVVVRQDILRKWDFMEYNVLEELGLNESDHESDFEEEEENQDQKEEEGKICLVCRSNQIENAVTMSCCQSLVCFACLQNWDNIRSPNGVLCPYRCGQEEELNNLNEEEEQLGGAIANDDLNEEEEQLEGSADLEVIDNADHGDD